MKEYTVRYNIGIYTYESVVKTSSSQAAMLWAEAIGGYHISIVSETAAWQEKEVAP